MLERAHTNRRLPKRDLCIDSGHVMQVKLVRKFSNALNGLDLTQVHVGDVINVSPYHAAMLVLEGWAEEIPQEPLSIQTIEITGRGGKDD